MPSLVQSASAKTLGSNGTTVTLGSNTTIGNTLAACVAAVNNSSGAPAVSSVKLGGVADNFAKAEGTTHGTVPGEGGEIWIDAGLGQASTSVAWALATSTSSTACTVMELSGILASPVDQVDQGTGTTSPWSSGTTATLSQAAEVAIGLGVMSGTTGASMTGPGSPWTELTQVTESSGSDTLFLTSGYQVVSATTGLSYNGTSANMSGYVAVIVTLKASVSISSSDTGSGAGSGPPGHPEITISAAHNAGAADSGSSARAGSVHASVPSADTGHGAEGGPVIRVSSSDTGHAAGFGAFRKNSADFGHAAGAAAKLRLEAADSAAGALGVAGIRPEASGTADSGSGHGQAVIRVSAAGTGTGSGASLKKWPSSADTGHGTGNAYGGLQKKSSDTGSMTAHATGGLQVRSADGGKFGALATGAQLSSNPYFAGASTTGWSAFNGTVTASATPPAGCPFSDAAEYTDNGVTSGALEGSGAHWAASPGTMYTVSAWVYTTLPNVKIGFDWLNASDQYLSTSAANVSVPSDTWTLVTTVQTAPASTASAYARVGYQSATSTPVWMTAILAFQYAPGGIDVQAAAFGHGQHITTCKLAADGGKGTGFAASGWRSSAGAGHGAGAAAPLPRSSADAGHAAFAFGDVGIWTYIPGSCQMADMLAGLGVSVIARLEDGRSLELARGARLTGELLELSRRVASGPVRHVRAAATGGAAGGTDAAELVSVAVWAQEAALVQVTLQEAR